VHTADRRSREGSSPRESSAAVGDGQQSLIREVNERIEELNGEWESGGRSEVLCECARAECLEKIEISAAAYERVRRSPIHFLVKPDHVAQEGERVVADTDSYVVVEKLGPGRSQADGSDACDAGRDSRVVRS